MKTATPNMRNERICNITMREK